MARIIRLLVLTAWPLAPLLAQTLSVTSAYDQSPPPFFRTEEITVALTGAEPYRPVTFLMGPGIPGLPVAGVAGTLRVDPFQATSLGGMDGLGLFGAPTPVTTDGSGSVSFEVVIPAAFGAALPVSVTFQAIVAQSPVPPTGGGPPLFLFAFSNGVDVGVVEPPPQSGFLFAGVEVPAGPDPHVLPEGSGLNVIIRTEDPANGFLPQTTVLPTVEFIANTGVVQAALSVSLIDEDPAPPSPGQPHVSAALLVQAPPYIGAPTNPPFTNAGPVTLRISYAGTGLYENLLNAERVTAPAGPGSATFLMFQSSVMPSVAQVSPQAGLTAGGCRVTVLGNGFLNGATVLFGTTAGTQVAVGAGGLGLQVDPPPLPEGTVTVTVRNIDHVPAVPRESAPNPPFSDYTVFSFSPGDITVTSVSPGSVVEGTGGEVIEVTGTCPIVNGYTALDPRSGATGLALGSDLNGVRALTRLQVTDITIPAPGTFRVTALAPEFPPGLNPTGPTLGALTNTGPKYVQVIAPPCLNPGTAPHLPLGAIPAAEPGNLFVYLAPAPPVITGFVPNNCGREEGMQTVTIEGEGFLTNDTTVPSSLAVLGPQVAFTGTISDAALTVQQIVDENTLVATTPDLAALALALPFQVDTRVANPDGQTSDTAVGEDDFFIYPSLAGPAHTAFTPLGTQLTVTTGTVGAPVVYNFLGDLTIPAGFTLNAAGEVPLIIRVKGDVEILGTIDLSGTALLGPASSGGGAGGPGAQPGALNMEDQFQGMPGTAVLDPATGAPYPNAFGSGGFHAPEGGGGGGGAMSTGGLTGQTGSVFGGPGGTAYGLVLLPVPVLGSGFPGEFLAPPGGSGGGAGGLGTAPGFSPAAPPPAPEVGFNGAGGHGGGSCLIAADGVITLRGGARILLDGQPGGAGQPAQSTSFTGGGGGGGAGGGLLLQAIQGIVVEAGSGGTLTLISAMGGSGGAGAGASNSGGEGSDGMIRLAIPATSARPGITLAVEAGTAITPAPDTTTY